MGGNVFKDGSTRRYEAAEYFLLVDRISPLLEAISYQFKVIPAYKSKESFGDMDVLIIPNKTLTRGFLDDLFDSCGNVVHNGGVWSLVFEELQIDLITTTDIGFVPALNYFKFCDYGNLRGKIIHKFGLKFGHDGLTLPIKSKNNNTIGTIMLTRDPQLIDKLFNFKTYEFETLEDMFDAVIGSYFFNPKIFAFENMNAVARIRDKKRSSYNAFLAYIADKDFGELYEFDPDKSTYLDWIFAIFPNAKPEFDVVWARKILMEEAAIKFNGNLVREWTGKDGKHLGEIMCILRQILPIEIVIAKSQEEIKHIVHNVIGGLDHGISINTQ